MPKTRITGYISILFLLIPLIAFAQTQEMKEHKVIKGDTLWGISKAELNDPFLWPKVWKENPGIENPNLIYPDQTIRIPLYLIQKEKRLEDASMKSAPASQESAVSGNQPDKVSDKGIKPKPVTLSPSPTDADTVTQQRYKGIRGIVLYSGQIIEGQIISMNAEILRIRTKDGKVRTYSFEREVEFFLKERNDS
jgi:LysM domain